MGHRICMLRRAASLFRELKAFEASTNSTASTLSSSKTPFIANIPASHAASCPTQSCEHPATFWMSFRVTLRIALEMSHRNVSPIPTGLTPGHLSRAIKRQAVKADIPSRLTYPEHSFLASPSIELHKSSETLRKEEHILFQSLALRPEGPAEPSIRFRDSPEGRTHSFPITCIEARGSSRAVHSLQRLSGRKNTFFSNHLH